MGLLDDMKLIAAESAIRSKELHVKLTITAGKKSLNLGILDGNSIVLRQKNTGCVYFDDVDGEFLIMDYQWDGPKYETKLVTTSKTRYGGNDYSEGRTKRTGRLTGAVVGTLIAPGPGTLIGAMAGTGNKKTKGVVKHRGSDLTTQTTQEVTTELPTTASMQLKHTTTGEVIYISFACNEAINQEVQRILAVCSSYRPEPPRIETPVVQELAAPADPIEQMKKYKELLDLGIISEEEFSKKKKELLSL